MVRTQCATYINRKISLLQLFLYIQHTLKSWQYLAYLSIWVDTWVYAECTPSNGEVPCSWLIIVHYLTVHLIFHSSWWHCAFTDTKIAKLGNLWVKIAVVRIGMSWQWLVWVGLSCCWRLHIFFRSLPHPRSTQWPLMSRGSFKGEPSLYV